MEADTVTSKRTLGPFAFPSNLLYVLCNPIISCTKKMHAIILADFPFTTCGELLVKKTYLRLYKSSCYKKYFLLLSLPFFIIFDCSSYSFFKIIIYFILLLNKFQTQLIILHI
jgi:hypothetical protein